MSTNVIMPQMGESIAEGTITKWFKKAGEAVKRDEPLFEISTDKVDAEIPSPATGTLLEIKIEPGATVPINTVVAVIGEAGEQPSPGTAAETVRSTGPAPKEPATAPPALPAPAAAPPSARSAPPASAARAAEAPVPSERNAEPAAGLRAVSIPANVESIEERIRTRSSPLVRKIAAEHGIEIGEIEGTGIYGRVTKNDILSYIDNRKTTAVRRPTGVAAPAAAPGPRPLPEEAEAIALGRAVNLAVGPRDEVIAMSNIRKRTAVNMVLSKRTSAHVATVFHVDYSAVARLREQHRDEFLKKNGIKLTYLPFIFKATVQALKEIPQMNASIDGESIVYHKEVHLGMAVALDWGLIVPVIKNADEKSILGLARASQDLAERARAKKLKPEEVQGGTFTITNPGVFGSLFGTPIIPQPQVGILGVGTIEKRPVVVTDRNGDDAIGIRTMGYLALSFDHRLIDGADADRFMGVVKKTLEAGQFGEIA